MIQIAMNYVVNPFSRILKALQYMMEIHGMARAADEMYRLGYTKEYQDTIEHIRQMRETR